MAIAFLEYSEADHGKARSTPYIANLINWLEWEIGEGKDALVELVAKGKADEARTLTGMIVAYKELIAKMNKKDPPPPEAEEEFVDHTLPEWEIRKK